jgi:hypothetical protein
LFAKAQRGGDVVGVRLVIEAIGPLLGRKEAGWRAGKDGDWELSF